MTAELAELLAQGQKALAAEDWDGARSAFETALAHAETGEALDGLAWASFAQGDYASALRLRERAYVEFERQGDLRRAVRMACWIAFLHVDFDGNMPAAFGWYARAEHLAAEVGDCVERGWVTLGKAGIHHDPLERQRIATEAMETARRFGDRDLEFQAMGTLGSALVAIGQIDHGMRFLDEAMAAVSGGEVHDPRVVAHIYCTLLRSCDRAGDVKRAEQWMAVVDRFLNRMIYSSAVCRASYAHVLTLVGRWDDAEREFLTALQLYERTSQTRPDDAILKLADLRLRQGRIEEAQQLLEGGEDDPQALPILVGIQLARGDTDWARTLIHRYLSHRSDPDVFAAPLIALGVDVYLASRQLAPARELVAQLARIAVETRNIRARALAAAAAGRLALATGDPAVLNFEEALIALAQVDMPLELARTRFDLARALMAENPSAAIAEARLAMKTFHRLSATHDMDSAAKLLRELGAGGRGWAKGFGTLSGRETDVLRLLGSGLSNPQIGERLFLSRRTVDHHVANILSKLGLANRAEAAAYAVSRLPQDRAAK
jgi:ATP/maltotriose-dependent transcriptional regulator MalT